MKANVSTQLIATIVLQLNEREALALLKLSGYNNDDLANHLAKFVHGFDKGTPEREGLLSLMESVKSLYEPLHTIEKVRKENKNIPVV